MLQIENTWSPSSGECKTLAMVIVILACASPLILVQKDRTLQQWECNAGAGWYSVYIVLVQHTGVKIMLTSHGKGTQLKT